MIEIVALFLLLGKIGDMARRRGRSPNLFGLLLVVCWFCGQVGAACATLFVFLLLFAAPPGATASHDWPARYFWSLLYGCSLLGAALGAWFAFRVARSLDPVDGVWVDTEQVVAKRSPIRGAIVGGVAGVVAGAGIVWITIGGVRVEGHIQSIAVAVLLGAGLIGAILGRQSTR